MITKEELLTYSPEVLAELNDELEREKIKTDLMYFSRKYLGYKDLNSVLHGEMCDDLLSIDRYKNMVFLLPRGHLKSSLLSKAWVIQQILINQNIRIAIINASYSLVVEFLGEIKEHMLNPSLVKLFPDILYKNPSKDTTWREEKITVKRTSVIGGYTIEVFGLTAAITGKHFDIIVFDDLQDMENSRTAEGINKVISRYKNCSAVLKPSGWRVIVGTRWKKEDFYNWLENKGYWMKVKSDTEIVDGVEVPILPELWSIEKLAEKRSELGPYFYSAQYKNKVLPEEDMVFREEWIKYYDEAPEIWKKIYILIDPALSKERKSDDTVISVVGEPAKGPLHLLKSKGISFSKSKGNVQVVVDSIFSEYVYWAKICPRVLVGIETAIFQHLLKQIVEKEMRERNIHFHITELKPGGRTKWIRISRLQPLFENDGIVLNRGNCKRLVQQLLDYPSSIHDDHIDALSYLMDVLIDGADVDVIDTSFYDDEDAYSLEAYIGRSGGNNAQNWLDY